MQDTNNFHTYFPGGILRVEGARPLSDGEKAIISSLDTLIEVTDFNIDQLQEERSLWNSKFEEATTLLVTNLAESERIGKESDIHCQNVQDMIHSLYQAMLKLGYTKTQLCR